MGVSLFGVSLVVFSTSSASPRGERPFSQAVVGCGGGTTPEFSFALAPETLFSFITPWVDLGDFDLPEPQVCRPTAVNPVSPILPELAVVGFT